LLLLCYCYDLWGGEWNVMIPWARTELDDGFPILAPVVPLYSFSPTPVNGNHGTKGG
jgi:hypothetical protein